MVEFDEDLTEELLPRVLPPGWGQEWGGFRNSFLSHDGIRVIASAERIDGKRWFHVSLSRSLRLPTWDDVRKVKDVFIGPNRSAVQALPPEDQYVNIHPYCLHLWCWLDGELVPDFRRMGGQI